MKKTVKSLRDVVLSKLESKVEKFSEKALPILRHMALFRDDGKQYETSEEIAEKMNQLINDLKKYKNSDFVEGAFLRVEWHEEDSFSEARMMLTFDQYAWGPGTKDFNKKNKVKA